MTPLGWRRVLIALASLLLVALVIAFAMRIPRTLSIFVIGAFIASAVGPIVRRLERRMPRTLAITTVYATLVLLVVVLALLVIPATVAQIDVLLGNAPAYVVASQHGVAALKHTLIGRLGTSVPNGLNLQAQISTHASDSLAWVLASAGTLVVNTLTVVLIGFAAVIVSYFFVAQRETVRASILSFVPPRRHESARLLMDEIALIFGAFVGGQVLLSTIVGVATWIVLLFLHAKFALLIAVVAGMLYAIPFFGMLVAQVLAALLALPEGPWLVISVTIAIFAIARIADYILVPKIMSESVGVSPIGVMFAVFAGGELFGIAGLLVGIPAAALVKLLFRYFVMPYIIRLQIGPVEAHGLEIDVETPAGTSVVVGVR